MKVIVLAYGSPVGWPHSLHRPSHDSVADREPGTVKRALETLIGEFAGSGELLASELLADPSSAKVIRLRNGIPVAMNGPLSESREYLAGYYLLECESLDRAIEIAGQILATRPGTVEVRPVMTPAGLEM